MYDRACKSRVGNQSIQFDFRIRFAMASKISADNSHEKNPGNLLVFTCQPMCGTCKFIGDNLCNM